MSLVETRTDGREHWITMRDPAGQNALSEAFAGELGHAFETIPDSARVVVLRGMPEVFCSGASREILAAVARGAVVPSDIEVARALLAIPVPTIAVMEGHAIGGGLALGLCADMALLARESRYGCSFMNMGFTPGMGVTGLLEWMVPRPVAHEMMYGGEPMRGADLERLGCNHVLPREELLPRARELAARIAEKPRVALAALKRHLASGKRSAFEEASATEALLHEITFAQPDITRRIEDGHAQ